MRTPPSARIAMRQASQLVMAVSPAALLLYRPCLVAACVLALPFRLAAQTPPQPSQQIIIKQMHFEPSTLNVRAGDRVEWKNEDIFSHTATANDGSFDSGLIAPGGSWQTTISKNGTIAYHCRPHPNMAAELVIAEPGGRTQHKDDGVSGKEGRISLRWSPPKRPEEIHPILVNFTAALLPLALLSDLLGRIFRRQGLHTTGLWMMVYEGAITPLTAIAGWWWRSSEADHLPAKLIMLHQWLGTGAALLFIVLAAWRWRFHRRALPPSWTYLAFVFVAVLGLIYQGSLGGAMVFGQ
jgi:plastocyanin/uncharacterized membrane protein